MRIITCLAALALASCAGHGTAADTTEEEGTPEDPQAEDVSGEDPSADEDVDGWIPPELEWTACSLYEGEEDGRAECAFMEVPFRWGEDDGRRFTVMAKRVTRMVGVLDGQIWLLEGGPGGAGTHGYAQYMEWIRGTFPSWESYVLDFRGTGHSGFLPCPADDTTEVTFESTIDEVQHCIDSQVADDLDVYGPTQSSHDLMAFIEATRVEGSKVVLWGNSAGTYWAQRFLQIHPDAVDGVVIEALLPPDFFGGFQEEGQDLVLKSILAMCGADSFCSGKLPDPETALTTLLTSLDAGHCPGVGWTSDDLAAVIGLLLYYRPYDSAIPGLVYRLTRCDPADVAAIDALVSDFQLVGEGTAFSIAVFYNVYFSEMWDHPDYTDSTAFLAYLDSIYAEALALDGTGYRMHEVFLRWPLYDDPLDGGWPDTDTPMLMLQGHLDPATPLFMAESMAVHYTGASQHYIEFPTGTHAIVFGTPTTPTGGGDCGVTLLTDFIGDPAGPLDTSCVDLVVPLDFEGAHDAPRLMGTADFWEG